MVGESIGGRVIEVPARVRFLRHDEGGRSQPVRDGWRGLVGFGSEPEQTAFSAELRLLTTAVLDPGDSGFGVLRLSSPDEATPGFFFVFDGRRRIGHGFAYDADVEEFAAAVERWEQAKAALPPRGARVEAGVVDHVDHDFQILLRVPPDDAART
jgi:hypothetical protein